MVWQALYDPTANRVYYFDETTGATSWDPPADPLSSLPAPPPPKEPYAAYPSHRTATVSDPYAQYSQRQQQQQQQYQSPQQQQYPQYPQQQQPVQQNFEIESATAAAGAAAADERRSNNDSPAPAEKREADARSGSIKSKIESALKTGPCGLRQCGTSLLHSVDPTTGPCKGCGCFRTFLGSFIYGIAFVPFVFALLQQAAADRSAVDPFGKDGDSSKLEGRSWRSGFFFLFAISLYCLIAFTAFPENWYETGEIRLTMLLAAVVGAIWIQQALTLRYISLRPELSQLEKNRSQKYKLCGRVYSTLNPRNPVNYIFLSVIVAEFFLFASVCFHPSMPWREGSATPDDYPLAEWLQTVIPESVIGTLQYGATIGFLIIIILLITLYLWLLGRVVYQSMDVFSRTATVACELLAGTMYTRQSRAHTRSLPFSVLCALSMPHSL